MTIDHDATDASLDALDDGALFGVICGAGEGELRIHAGAVFWRRHLHHIKQAVRGAAARPGGCPTGEDRAAFEEDVVARLRDSLVMRLSLAQCLDSRKWKAYVARAVATNVIDCSRELRARRERESRAERLNRQVPPPPSPEVRAMQEQAAEMTREITDAVAVESDPRHIQALYLEADGWSKVAIAEAFGVSPTSIHNWLSQARKAIRHKFEQRGVRELHHLISGR